MAPFLMRLLLLAPGLLTAGGVGLLALTGLQTGAEIAQGLGRGRGRRFAWLHDQEGATVTLEGRRFTCTWKALAPVGGGLLLALLWRHPALSLWSLLLGIAAAVTLQLSEPHATADRRATAEVFLGAFRSRYTVSRSLGAALRGAVTDLGLAETDPLAQAVAQTVQRLYAGEEQGAALEGLGQYSPLCQRLVTILKRSDLAAQEETLALLETLEAQARQSRRLAERAQVALTVVRLTLHVLVAANSAALLLMPLLATWRRHYVADPLTYIAGSALALGGCGYFRFKIRRLEESL
jgi:hypothetical protein